MTVGITTSSSPLPDECKMGRGGGGSYCVGPTCIRKCRCVRLGIRCSSLKTWRLSSTRMSHLHDVSQWLPCITAARNIPKCLEGSCLPQSQEQQRIQELPTAQSIHVRSIRTFSLIATTQRVQGDLAHVLRIIVLARHEGIQSTSQAVDGRVVRRIIFIGEYDMEVSVQLFSGKVSESLRDEGEGDQVGRRGLSGKASVNGQVVQSPSLVLLIRTKESAPAPTCLKISFCASAGRS